VSIYKRIGAAEAPAATAYLAHLQECHPDETPGQEPTNS
jgi:hypothetical protein